MKRKGKKREEKGKSKKKGIKGKETGYFPS